MNVAAKLWSSIVVSKPTCDSGPVRGRGFGTQRPSDTYRLRNGVDPMDLAGENLRKHVDCAMRPLCTLREADDGRGRNLSQHRYSNYGCGACEYSRADFRAISWQSRISAAASLASVGLLAELGTRAVRCQWQCRGFRVRAPHRVRPSGPARAGDFKLAAQWHGPPQCCHWPRSVPLRAAAGPGPGPLAGSAHH